MVLKYKFCEDLTSKGLIPISLFIFNILLSPFILIKYGFNIDIGLYFLVSLVEVIFIINVIFNTNKDSNEINKYIYEIVTKGELNSYRKLIVHIETKPYATYISMFIIAMLPIPGLKNIPFTKRIVYIFAKIGVLHLFLGLFITHNNKIDYCNQYLIS